MSLKGGALRDDEKLRKSLGAEAGTLIRNGLTWERRASKILDFMETRIDSPGR